MSDTIDTHIHRAFDQGEGILRLTPTWVPREFCIPGRRIKLHPDDYYAFLHAPSSLCTYEPQKASDIFAMFENVVHNQVIPEELLWKNTPQARMGDLDFLLEIVDWDANLDPDFRNHHLMIPKPVRPLPEMREAGYEEKWICYRSDAYSAKELTILPGRSVTIRDEGAYGLITMQGRGRMNQWTLETPALIRFGQLTRDEYFVSEEAARTGIKLTNDSDCDPLVMLKHFGPGNPDLAEVVV